MEWPLLAGIPDEDARRVLEIARRRTFARREVVFHRGDTALLSVIGPPDAFGEIRCSRTARRAAPPWWRWSPPRPG